MFCLYQHPYYPSADLNIFVQIWPMLVRLNAQSFCYVCETHIKWELNYGKHWYQVQNNDLFWLFTGNVCMGNGFFLSLLKWPNTMIQTNFQCFFFHYILGAIIFGSDQEVREVMRAVRRNNATGQFSWIGSDGWSARNLVSDGNEPEVKYKYKHKHQFKNQMKRNQRESIKKKSHEIEKKKMQWWQDIVDKHCTTSTDQMLNKRISIAFCIRFVLTRASLRTKFIRWVNNRLHFVALSCFHVAHQSFDKFNGIFISCTTPIETNQFSRDKIFRSFICLLKFYLTSSFVYFSLNFINDGIFHISVEINWKIQEIQFKWTH